MSKIICDVCGTSYPETVTQCPICGCVRPVDAVTVNNDSGLGEKAATGSYTYVKGGRFSKANVKKRNNAVHNTATEPDSQEEPTGGRNEKSDKGLIIAVCVLLLAIVAVVVYIALHFFGANNTPPAQTDGSSTADTTLYTEDPTQDTTVLRLPCEDIYLPESVIELDKLGAAFLLNYSTEPLDTSDVVTFTSSDEAVATINESGKIVAVGAGQAVITVRCGEIEKECRVVCTFEDVPDETTAPTVEPTVSAEDFKLNREDFTLSQKGQTWTLYTGNIPVKQIVWTSDNEKVATIKDGVVTAVGTGSTTVYGEYNGTKLSCMVRCSPSVGKYVESVDNDQPASGDYNISSTDVTITVGESFTLSLSDADKNTIDVIWTVADDKICSASGNNITGLAPGMTKVYVAYDGTEYACTVRVK